MKNNDFFESGNKEYEEIEEQIANALVIGWLINDKTIFDEDEEIENIMMEDIEE